MRMAFILALSLAASTAHAGIEQTCSAKKKDKAAYANCIDAERKRAANTLRDMDPHIMHVLNAHTRSSGNTDRLEAYRTDQAMHVRKRNHSCRQQNDINRAICEGNMDNAQIQALQKYLKQEKK